MPLNRSHNALNGKLEKGRARARRDGRFIIIDNAGNDIEIISSNAECQTPVRLREREERECGIRCLCVEMTNNLRITNQKPRHARTNEGRTNKDRLGVRCSPRSQQVSNRSNKTLRPARCTQLLIERPQLSPRTLKNGAS